MVAGNCTFVLRRRGELYQAGSLVSQTLGSCYASLSSCGAGLLG